VFFAKLNVMSAVPSFFKPSNCYRGTGGGYTPKTYSFLSNEENAQLQQSRDRSEELFNKYSYLEKKDDDFDSQLQSLAKKYKTGGKKTKSRRKSQKKKTTQRRRSQKKKTTQRRRSQKKKKSQKRRSRH
jgi:hypothetical protein